MFGGDAKKCRCRKRKKRRQRSCGGSSSSSSVGGSSSGNKVNVLWLSGGGNRCDIKQLKSSRTRGQRPPRPPRPELVTKTEDKDHGFAGLLR